MLQQRPLAHPASHATAREICGGSLTPNAHKPQGGHTVVQFFNSLGTLRLKGIGISMMCTTYMQA